MKITIVGSGNVAFALGKLLLRSGHKIVEICGRNEQEVSRLATITGAKTNFLLQPNIEADLYLLALRDDVLERLPAFELGNKGVWVHTAGAISDSVLDGKALATGVWYPLQRLLKNNPPPEEIPFILTSKHNEVLEALMELSESIGSQWLVANNEDRLRYHLSAVFVNNFPNYLYTLAADLCEASRISFTMLQPLIDATTDSVTSGYPGNRQTGPAIRKDVATMEKHMALLSQNKEAMAVYAQLSAAITAHYYSSKD